MHIASGVVSNHWLQRALTEATQRVSEGISLHISLAKVGQMPPMLLHMVAAGEQSGTLDTMLGRVADFQQSEVERVVSTMVKLFEPLYAAADGRCGAVYRDGNFAAHAQHESAGLDKEGIQMRSQYNKRCARRRGIHLALKGVYPDRNFGGYCDLEHFGWFRRPDIAVAS